MRRSLLLLAAVALAASAPAPARADRLGGSYRGPDDLYVIIEDPPPGAESGVPDHPDPSTAPNPPETGTICAPTKQSPQDDKDRIWPFYFENAREEYLAAVVARRAPERLASPQTLTGLLSPEKEPRRERRAVTEEDRAVARELVLARLRDSDSHVRDAGVLALGKSGCEEVVAFMEMAAYRDSDPAVREDALLALGLSGCRTIALPALLRALSERPLDRRESRSAYAALGLGLLGDREGASAPLRALYETTASRSDRVSEAVAAAEALAMLGDGQALPLFRRTLAARETTTPVRCVTLHALGRYAAHPDAAARHDAFAALRKALPERDLPRESAILALGCFPEVETVALLRDQGLEDEDVYCRIFTAHSLGRIAAAAGTTSPAGEKAVAALERVSGDDLRDRWLFQAATLALASLGRAGHEQPALGLLANQRKMGRHSASAVALSVGLPGNVPPEGEAALRTTFLSRASGGSVQAYAGLGLAACGARDAAEVLSTTFRGESRPYPDIARVSALSLGLVGGAAEADVLIRLLGDGGAVFTAESTRGFVRGAAVQGLGFIGDGGTIEKLRPLLDAESWETRAFATAALGYLLESEEANRVAPRISGIFRHLNYRLHLPLVWQVRSTL